MLKKRKSRIYYFAIILLLFYSCVTLLKTKSDNYLDFIKNNSNEIRDVGNYIFSKNFHENFSKYKITKNVKDSLIINFYKKYNLLPLIYSYPANFVENNNESDELIKDSSLVFVKARDGLFKNQYNLIISFKKENIKLNSKLLNVHKINNRIYLSKY